MSTKIEKRKKNQFNHPTSLKPMKIIY